MIKHLLTALVLYSISLTALATELRDFDHLMETLLKKYDVPGGSLAISKGGRLIYAKGFGYADIEKREKVSTETRFRISSVSKPITSTAVLRLVEQGRLRLSDNPYDILGKLPTLLNYATTPKIEDITILDLLNHTSGQAVYNNAGRITSPMQPPVSRVISYAFGVPHPPEFKYVAAYMRGQPLLNTPGEKFKYSNYGYALLGAVVEKVTNTSFEEYVRKNILKPIDVTCMRFGKTRRDHALKNEAKYYPLQDGTLVDSVFDNQPKDTFPYAGRHIQGWGAAGAWIASPSDIVKFVNHVDGLSKPTILRKSSIKRMLEHNEATQTKPGFWYGLGWRIQQKRTGAHWYHDGSSNSGSAAIMMRTNTGIVWSAFFNKRLPPGRALYKEFNRQMWAITRSINDWPVGKSFYRNDCN